MFVVADVSGELNPGTSVPPLTTTSADTETEAETTPTTPEDFSPGFTVAMLLALIPVTIYYKRRKK